MSARGDAETGFTLIEVLVALVISAFILTIVMSAALYAQARQKRAELHERAVLMAASLLAQQVLKPATSGVTRGQQDKIRWEIDEQPLAQDPRGFFVLDRIEARMFDEDGSLLFKASTRKLKSVVQP